MGFQQDLTTERERDAGLPVERSIGFRFPSNSKCKRNLSSKLSRNSPEDLTFSVTSHISTCIYKRPLETRMKARDRKMGWAETLNEWADSLGPLFSSSFSF